jgi:hypothetical protein
VSGNLKSRECAQVISPTIRSSVQQSLGPRYASNTSLRYAIPLRSDPPPNPSFVIASLLSPSCPRSSTLDAGILIYTNLCRVALSGARPSSWEDPARSWPVSSRGGSHGIPRFTEPTTSAHLAARCCGPGRGLGRKFTASASRRAAVDDAGDIDAVGNPNCCADRASGKRAYILKSGLTRAVQGTRRAGSHHVVGCSDAPECRDAGRQFSAVERVCDPTSSPTGSDGPRDGKGSDSAVFSRYDVRSRSRCTC